MNIRIDDDVPLPEPSKPDTWVSGPKVIADTKVFTDGFDEPKEAVYVMPHGGWPKPERYPAETTYDAKGVPTVDCYLVGGPLNGRHGPIVGTAQVVELNIYAADGSVSSVELYELGSRGDLGGRYWKGTKAV